MTGDYYRIKYQKPDSGYWVQYNYVAPATTQKHWWSFTQIEDDESVRRRAQEEARKCIREHQEAQSVMITTGEGFGEYTCWRDGRWK